MHSGGLLELFRKFLLDFLSAVPRHARCKYTNRKPYFKGCKFFHSIMLNAKIRLKALSRLGKLLKTADLFSPAASYTISKEFSSFVAALVGMACRNRVCCFDISLICEYVTQNLTSSEPVHLCATSAAPKRTAAVVTTKRPGRFPKAQRNDTSSTSEGFARLVWYPFCSRTLRPFRTRAACIWSSWILQAACVGTPQNSQRIWDTIRRY